MTDKTSAWKDESLKGTGVFSVTWVINAPWAHPFWPQYLLQLYDLTTPSERGTPIEYLPGATHEFVLWALDPDHPIEKEGGTLEPEDIHTLSPPNYAYQFRAASNQAAEERLQAIVDGIVAREISPDMDYRRTWDNALFPDAFALVT